MDFLFQTKESSFVDGKMTKTLQALKPTADKQFTCTATYGTERFTKTGTIHVFGKLPVTVHG